LAYVDRTLAINWLGTAYDATNDLTNANIDAFIVKADGLVDTWASPRYNLFNAYGSSKTDGTDTYTTPPLVINAALHQTVAWCFNQIRARTSNTSLAEVVAHYEDRAQFYMDLLANGPLLPPERYRDETLSAGDGTQGWELSTSEAFIGVSPSGSPLDNGIDPPFIHRDSVVVSSSSTVASAASFTAAEAADMQIGVDFDVTFEPRRRKWVFEYKNGVITSDFTTLQVSYLWDYQRSVGDEGGNSGVMHAG
jgi:hypothetical protein